MATIAKPVSEKTPRLDLIMEKVFAQTQGSHR